MKKHLGFVAPVILSLALELSTVPWRTHSPGAAVAQTAQPGATQTGQPDATQTGQPGATQTADDLDQLIGDLRHKLERWEDEREGRDMPVALLARELDRARQDIERLAEMVLRQQIADIRQDAAYAVAVDEIEALDQDLRLAEQQLASVQQERDRIETLARESADRVDQLAWQLLNADVVKSRLQQNLAATQAETATALAELNDARAQLAAVDEQIDRAIQESNERVKLFEEELRIAQANVDNLERELSQSEASFSRQLAARDTSIISLQARQAKAKVALEQVLEVLDEEPAEELAAVQTEALRRAEVSNLARQRVLDDLGFRRDEGGQLLPPEIDTQMLANLATIEPAAGPDGGVAACQGMLKPADRPYLHDRASREWAHYLVGTLRFAEARFGLNEATLAPMRDCLQALSADPNYYFKLVGHTDARGTASFNQRLSLERAEAARQLFAGEIAIQPWRLLAVGRGEDFPIADNDLEQGRELNRRVEVYAVRAAL